MVGHLLTMHAYRSWVEDNPRGYVQRGQRGVQAPNVGISNYRSGIALHSPMRFNVSQMQLAITTTREVCGKLGFDAIAGSCTATHLHVLVGLTGAALTGGAREGDQGKDTNALCARIKSIVGWRLSQQLGTTGNRWFSRGKDATPVIDEAHLRYLVGTYLPKHEMLEGGVFAKWCEIG
jgi:hypothetical protein